MCPLTCSSGLYIVPCRVKVSRAATADPAYWVKTSALVFYSHVFDFKDFSIWNDSQKSLYPFSPCLPESTCWVSGCTFSGNKLLSRGRQMLQTLTPQIDQGLSEAENAFSARPFLHLWKMLLEKKHASVFITWAKLFQVTSTASFLHSEQCWSRQMWCSQRGRLCLCEMKLASESVSLDQNGDPKMCMRDEM